MNSAVLIDIYIFLFELNHTKWYFMGELNHIASAIFQAWNTGERGKVQYQKEVKNNIFIFFPLAENSDPFLWSG